MLTRRRLLPEKPRRDPLDTSLAIVNIVFLLLFFFLSTRSMMSGPGVDMDLPKVTDLPVADLPHPILVLAEDGRISLNGVVTDPEDLQVALKEFSSVNILIDRNAPAQELLGLLANPGFDALDVRLVTQNRMSAR